MYFHLNNIDRLFKAFEIANNPRHLRKFLTDFLSKKELEGLAKRLYIICLIKAGAPYNHIQNLTGASSKTVAKLSLSMRDRESGLILIARKLDTEIDSQYFE